MRNIKHLLIFIALIFISVNNVFSIEPYVSELYQEIDYAFINRSEKELNEILSSNQGDKNYYLIENYALKKIRRLVIKREYDFALQANLIVIDNNLDNSEAVEMYSVIATALEEQKKLQQLEEQRLLAERARLQEEMEKQKVLVTKEFNTAVNEEGNSYFVRSKNEKYTAAYWNFRFGMADINFVNDIANNYSSIRYGLSGDFVYEYLFDKIALGIDLSGEAIILPFVNNDDTLLTSFSIMPKISFPGVLKNLFIRAGFASVMTLGNRTKTTLHETIYTPAFGIGLSRIKLGDVAFAFNYDYYLGHLAYEDLNVAMAAQVNFGFPIAEMDKVKLNFNLGLKDTFLMKTNGIENRAGIVLAIGAENVTN